MEIPSILQGHSRTRLLQVTAVGAVATLVIGFSWGGWVTDTKAPSAAEIVQFDFNSLAGTKAESMAAAAEASGKEVRGAADAKGNNR